jgi:hypothetical protein
MAYFRHLGYSFWLAKNGRRQNLQKRVTSAELRVRSEKWNCKWLMVKDSVFVPIIEASSHSGWDICRRRVGNVENCRISFFLISIAYAGL